MAFPVILVDSATGSDSQASGAGPATALFGTGDASTDGAGTTVTLTAGTDLTNVLTDGSHVIYLADATAGARNFGKITGKAGSGGATPTVTVANAFGLSLSGKSWAIGGRRASLFSDSNSYKLVENNGGNGDLLPGWIVELQSGHTETRSSDINLRRAGDTTDGQIVVRGASGTMPVVTLSGAGTELIFRNNYWCLKDFHLAGSGGATNAMVDASVPGGGIRIEGLKISGFSGTLIDGTASGGIRIMNVIGCELDGGATGVRVTQNARVIGNYLHGQTSNAIESPSSALTGLTIASNLIVGAGGDGIKLTQTRTDQFSGVAIIHNTIDDCTGDGIDYTGDNDGLHSLTIYNNILSNNGGYGINFASLTAAKVLARGPFISNNNTYNNTSGASNLSGVLQNDPGLDPTFTNAAGEDYSIGTNLKAQGYPEVAFPGSATTSYVDIGAAQREEPAGGGGSRAVIIGG